MPHLKCVTCRTRYYTPGGPGDPIDDLCPRCGSAFEPVGELSELVGLQAITSRDRFAARDASGTQQGFLDRLGDLLDRRAREAPATDTATESATPTRRRPPG